MKTVTTKMIPAKIVHDTCYNCPFVEYDSHYGRSFDSGYDCNHEDGDGRIADDYQITQYDEKLREAKRLPLLPMEVTDRNPMSIPDSCPLEDVTE